GLSAARLLDVLAGRSQGQCVGLAGRAAVRLLRLRPPGLGGGSGQVRAAGAVSATRSRQVGAGAAGAIREGKASSGVDRRMRTLLLPTLLAALGLLATTPGSGAKGLPVRPPQGWDTVVPKPLPKWNTDYNAARKEAAEANLPLLILFVAPDSDDS